MNSISTKKRAFTLIELLVVIVIVGILATIGLAQYNSYAKKARDATVITAMSQLKKQIELYCVEHGHVPVSTSCGDAFKVDAATHNPNGAWCNTAQNYQNGHWIHNNRAGSPQNLPNANPLPPLYDPDSEIRYVTPQNYGYYGRGDFYVLVFTLENENNDLSSTDGYKSFHYWTATTGVTITWGGACNP